MISKFTKPLLFSSVLALGALGFVACSEENGTNINNPVTSSSSIIPISVEQETELNAIVSTDLGISSENLSRIKFKGTLTLDLSDSETVDDIDAVRFTSLHFDIISQSHTSAGVATHKDLDLVNQFVTTISFLEIGLQTDLSDPTYTECGQYYLIVTSKASDGVLESIAVDTIPFVRPEEKCKIPESSSSSVSVPGAALTAITATVNTKSDKCLDLATGTASAATTGDICFTRTGSAVQLSSTTGLKFAVYDNQNDEERINDYSKNWLPEQNGTPTTDSFLYDPNGLKEFYPDFVNEGDVFFVAVSPTFVQGSAAGFYAFIVTEVSTPDANGDITISLRIYKG